MMYKEVECLKVELNNFQYSLHPVIQEMPLSVVVNGRHVLTAMISPTQIEQFIVGFLYTEKIIKKIEDIESILIENNSVSVLTKNPFEILVSKKTILSGCGSTMSFLDSDRLPNINSNLTLTPETIYKAVGEALKSDLHILTGGIHVVSLYDSNGKVCIIEDIGRHNALDKVIGYALGNNIDLSKTFIICSGRISSEMTRKCLIANIPIAVSRGATTTLSIEIAKSHGLTIVGFVRNNKMNVYCNWQRIEGFSNSN